MTTHLRSDIEALLAEWAFCVDDGRATHAIHLFSEKAAQAMPSGLSEGKNAILAGLQRRQDMTHRTTRHLVSNLRLHELESSEGRARVGGRWVMSLFRSDAVDRSPTLQLVADVMDEYENFNGRWLIAYRKLVPVFGAA